MRFYYGESQTGEIRPLVSVRFPDLPTELFDCILDTGANYTYLSHTLAEQLGLFAAEPDDWAGALGLGGITKTNSLPVYLLDFELYSEEQAAGIAVGDVPVVALDVDMAEAPALLGNSTLRQIVAVFTEADGCIHLHSSHDFYESPHVTDASW